MSVVLNKTDYPGKYQIRIWHPECGECWNDNRDRFHLLEEWSNAGGFFVGPDQPDMEGGFRGWEVQCEVCGDRHVEPEYFYTDDERASNLIVQDVHPQKIN